MSRPSIVDAAKAPPYGINPDDLSKVRHALGLIDATGNVASGLGNLAAMASRYHLGATLDSSTDSRRDFRSAADWLDGVILALESVSP